MESLGVRELRDRLSQVIRSVEKGQTVRIVRHGVAVAELQPIPKDRGQQIRIGNGIRKRRVPDEKKTSAPFRVTASLRT